MKPQLSQDYNVDARYAGGRNSADNEVGKAFVASYLRRRKIEAQGTASADRQEDNRFTVAGPGNATYTFKNGFRASK
jgi:hypothetical protein